MDEKRSTTYPRLDDLPTGDADRVLALDCTGLLAPEGPIALNGVINRRFADLGAALLDELKPTVVVMPLFYLDQDAMTVVEALQAMGFSGRILVIAPQLPRPALVERELRAAGPGERLTLVSP